MISRVLLCCYINTLLFNLEGNDIGCFIGKCLLANSHMLTILCLLCQRLVQCVACCLLMIHLLLMSRLSSYKIKSVISETTDNAASFTTPEPVSYVRGNAIDVVNQ